MKWGLYIFLGAVLATGLFLQLRPEPKSAPMPIPDLRKILAREPSGWETRDLPLGATEVVQQAAEKTLRYDTYFLRAYRRGSIEFTIYVAYWGPGKHPPQMITQHTPDRCWTMNGMTCEEMRFNVPAQLGEVALWPAQWRKFRAPDGRAIHTMFWHLVGGRPYDFGKRFYDVPDPVTYWAEAFRFFAGSRPEQYFVRITSSVAPEQIWNDAGFQSAVSGFLTVGLAPKAQTRPAE